MLGASTSSMSSSDIQNLIVATANQYGVDPSLALEVAIQESGLNPNAVSSAGAQGVFQLMPATAAQFGVTNPFDPTQNVPAGIQYLAQLIGMFGDTSEALAAYNWGPTNVQNAITQYGTGWLSQAPAETQNYVQSILTAVGSEYTISAGTTASLADSTPANSTMPGFLSPSLPAVEEAGIVPSGLSLPEIAIILGLGIVTMGLLAD